MSMDSSGFRTAAELNAKGIRLTEAGRYGEAVGVFDQAIQAAPGHPGILYNRSEAKRLAGDSGGARDDLLEVLRLEPGDADSMHGLGLIAYEEDNYAEAESWYDRALKARPDFAEAWNDKGVIGFRSNDFAKARGCFEKAVGIDPDFADAWFNLADACEELGLRNERAKALAALETARRHAGESDSWPE